MKKIIATVLAMVMALALCSTAFAANASSEKYDVVGYAKTTDKSEDEVGYYPLKYTAAKAPSYNSDGDCTAFGNVAYYTYGTGEDSVKYYVAVSTKAEADLVIYTKENYKNPMLYLADLKTNTYAVGEKLTFGTKCGDTEKPDGYISSYTYYSAEMAKDDAHDKAVTVYAYADEEGDKYVLVDGKLITVTATNQEVETVAHEAVATVENGKVTGYTCSVCGAKALKAGNYSSIPSGAEIIDEDNYWYFPAKTSNNTSTDTKKADSAKTFDAGIALYAGMALTSVAGSAVVLGKKKEF